MPANPVNDRRVANAVMLKNFSFTVKSAIIQNYLIMESPEKQKSQTMSKNIIVIVSDSKKLTRQVKPAFLKAWIATQM